MGKDAKEDQKFNDMLNKDKPKHHNKLMQDIEKARHAADDLIIGEKQTSNKKGALESLKNDPKTILDPLPAKQDKKKLDPFEDIDLLDFDDSKSKPKKEVKETKKEEKKDSKKKDVNDFDFEFEDIHPDEGSKIPPDGNKINKETNPVNDKLPTQTAPKGLEKDPKKKDLEIEIPHQETGTSKTGNNDEKDEDEYIVIDGKRFREIQIEGEEEEFLMDDDGNIYDREGVYIGTAKDGGEEEEEEDEHLDK